jgi:hypothetical protein
MGGSGVDPVPLTDGEAAFEVTLLKNIWLERLGSGVE